jgi:hypothetical protein
MSIATITLVGTPDPDPGTDPAILRDRLAVAEQAYGDLLRAAQATLAAEAAYLPYPLTWLAEHLENLGQLPPPGARPAHYVPCDPPVWGRR